MQDNNRVKASKKYTLCAHYKIKSILNISLDLAMYMHVNCYITKEDPLED